jgi:enoyl-CoA hydratase/carnithine racemase
LDMILTGAPVTAERALELGLVNRVAEDGQALSVAMSLATAIAANAPLAVRAAKLIAEESADWDLDDAFDRQAPYTDQVRASDDAAEGARAFVEKRAPQWSGS